MGVNDRCNIIVQNEQGMRLFMDNQLGKMPVKNNLSGWDRSVI